MPKYYCDYCDAFLTHDSPSVRKTHNGGRKHKENVRMYYQAWMEEQAQKLIDATTRAFTSQRMLAPGAAPGFVPPPTGVPVMIPPRGPFVNPMTLVRPPVVPSASGFFTPPVLPPGMASMTAAAIPSPAVTAAAMAAAAVAASQSGIAMNANGGMPTPATLRTAIKQQLQD